MMTAPDKKAAQAIGVRLRNLLKLPKAHKWVCYEWFYSNIDMSVSMVTGWNDWQLCSSFPDAIRYENRVEQWSNPLVN